MKDIQVKNLTFKLIPQPSSSTEVWVSLIRNLMMDTQSILTLGTNKGLKLLVAQ